MRKTDASRNRQLGSIHMAAKRAGLDDAGYRDMLWAVARVRSAADLDFPGRMRVIDHLNGVTHAEPEKARRPTPCDLNSAMARRVTALLRAAGRVDAYADGVARRMFKVHFWEWCRPDQLHKLLSALEIDKARRIER